MKESHNSAEAEINELKAEIRAQQEFISRLKRQLTSDQSQESETQESYIKEIARLCQDLEKQKVLTQALKNQKAEAEKKAESEMTQMRNAYETDFQQMSEQIRSMDNYI